MKKLTTIIALCFSLSGFGQKDSIPPIPDSVQFISKRHIAEAYKRLDIQLKSIEDKLTVAQYKKLLEGIDAAFGELVNVATEEYTRRIKKK